MTYLSKMTPRQNFKNLCNLTTELVGLPKGSLSNRSREQKYQVPRAVISVIARQEENIHRDVIGKGIDRDRTCINHYEKFHTANYKSYELYRKTYIDVYIAYCSQKKQKKYFKTQESFNKFLDKHNINSSETHNTELALRSGKFYVILQLSHEDFYNVIEIIKFAFKDYHYEYKVI
tara:strand:+ start:1652 stop:2179 length:528 start_codon:yes stop_codon:yes gene_type:complete